MMRAYFDYANRRITIHANQVCIDSQEAAAAGARHVDISARHFSQEIQRLIDGQVAFLDPPLTGWDKLQRSSLWLTVQFNDPQFELALIGHVRRLLGQRYDRFLSCEVIIHCWPASPGPSATFF